MKTYNQLCIDARNAVRACGSENPNMEARSLVAFAAGKTVGELIRDYIINVKGGTIAPECDDNWKITGNDWDEALHQKAVEKLSSGELTIPTSEDGRTPNIKAITEEDVK